MFIFDFLIKKWRKFNKKMLIKIFDLKQQKKLTEIRLIFLKDNIKYFYELRNQKLDYSCHKNLSNNLMSQGHCSRVYGILFERFYEDLSNY